MSFKASEGNHKSQYYSKVNLFKLRRNHRKTESKSVLAMKNIAIWIAFYRENPHRFVSDFLGIQLKPFQCILLWAMIHHHYFVFVASRGLGFKALKIK